MERLSQERSTVGAAAVVAVAATSSLRGRTRSLSSPWSAMDRYAAAIREQTSVRVESVPITSVETELIVDRLLTQAPAMSAVLILGLDESGCEAVRVESAARGGPWVVSELDVVSVGLAAATVGMLRRDGVPPLEGRVVLCDPEYAPRLGPILIACGISEISYWHQRDKLPFPLPRIMEHQDVLIDLTECAPSHTAPGRVVRCPIDREELGRLVAPGLLSALAGSGDTLAPMDPVDLLAAATRGLALITAPGRALTADPDSFLITASIARHITHLVDERAGRSHA